MPSTDPTPPAAAVCEGCGVRLAGSPSPRVPRCPRCEKAIGPRPLADALFMVALAVGGTLLVTAATFTMTEVSTEPSRGALIDAWRRPATP
ncbi:hypothetical protein [Nitrospirillum sp. BR 11828]|uniref:hypothetical protein n=1 Tax=Nitrospirillum sp. BR 11828 TaxID=3104325 RepID=UPI002ACA84A6|nr:hypothetical protein [Nitrospirillum sp. BR 11828]MDZ5646652.1 hypothetical protein [Nitrospirillum sp. BR 11828]